MTPGVYEGISNDGYHDGDGVSSTQIKVMALQTPAHYHWKYISEENEHEVKDKWGALAVGTLFHTLLLEPEKDLGKEFLFVEEINRRSKAGKENFAAALEDATKTQRNIITLEERDNVQKMVKAARGQALFSSLFSGGVAEVSCYWIDEDTGILCKCRPDYLHPDNIIVDLKSCIDASEDGAGRASFKFGYYISAAFYLDGVAAATGKPTESFIFAFMEKAAPFCASPYVITPEDVALGRALYQMALAKLRDCTDADRWPGYGANITELELPAYGRKQMRSILGREQGE